MESLISDREGLRYLNPKPHPEMIQIFTERISRMDIFLGYLNHPEKSYPAIHVTGTSGKGSVSTMAASLLKEAGFRTGLHTSPYLQIPNEKLIIDSKMISPSIFSRYLNNLRQKYLEYIGKNPENIPRYGEVWTALTHLIFAKEKIDWGVIEVGMGGRFDLTNILGTQVAVINNVDFDHLEQLGPTLEDIAWHKAGVIKPGKPAVTAVIQPKLLSIIQQEAEKQQAPLYVLSQDFMVENIHPSGRGIVADIITPFSKIRDLYINLSGEFQAFNAVAAIMAVQLAAQNHNFGISEAQIRKGLADTFVPGRFEIMQEKPLAVIDGAHNPAKMKSLAGLIASQYADREITLVIGMLRNKDVTSSLEEILPLVNRVIATEPKVIGKPPLKAEEMKAQIQSIRCDIKIEVIKDVHQAIELALSHSRPEEIVLVTGSIYMLGQARAYWHRSEDILRELEL